MKKKSRVTKRMPLRINDLVHFFNEITYLVYRYRGIPTAVAQNLERDIAKQATKCKKWAERFVRQERDKTLDRVGLLIVPPSPSDINDEMIKLFGPPHDEEAEARIKRMLKRQRREMRMRQYKARRKA